MKKIFTLAFIALTLLATACGKSNNDNPSTPQNDAKKALIGTWYLVSNIERGEKMVLTECDKKEHIVFKEDLYIFYRYRSAETMDDCINTNPKEGKYTISNNNLMVDDDDIIYVFSITGDKLVLTYTEESGNGNKEISEKIYVKR